MWGVTKAQWAPSRRGRPPRCQALPDRVLHRPTHLCSPANFRLRDPMRDVVAMQTRQSNLEGSGEIPLRRLVKEALRVRPSRVAG